MSPRPLSAKMRRALEIRVSILEAEDRTDAEKYEHLYEIGNEILARMIDRQRQKRLFREILLNAPSADTAADQAGRAAA